MKFKSILKNIFAFSFLIILFPTLCSAQNPPVDYRYQINPGEFKFDKSENAWVTSPQKVKFPFDELIYSWSIHLPKSTGMRLYLQVGFGDTSSSPWLYAGYWGSVKFEKERSNPKFEHGQVEMDDLVLTKKANSYRFKFVPEGETPVNVRPALHVIITDNKPDDTLVKKYLKSRSEHNKYSEIIYNLPLRAQADSKDNPLPDRCQSAALATAMEYFGKKINLEDIIPYTTDSEYGAYGIWPRTIQTAVEFGFDAYIDRFRTWDDVRSTLVQHKVILCSITMPAKDSYIAPPYSSMPGHIVALNGITDDGRVIITDSALSKDNKGYACQWLMLDFQKVWMRNKGGVGLVVSPPKDFKPEFITKLDSFPKIDYKPKEDSTK